MLEMFKGVANSPETTITNNISNSDTLIYVLDETRIPEPPNLMVLGTGVGAETIKVLSIDGNAITVERGFQGIPRAWNAGTIIARNFTEYDYNTLVENVKTLKGNTDTNADDILSLMNYVGNLENLDTVEKSNIVLALNEIYQDLASHKAEIASNLEFYDDYTLATKSFREALGPSLYLYSQEEFDNYINTISDKLSAGEHVKYQIYLPDSITLYGDVRLRYFNILEIYKGSSTRVFQKLISMNGYGIYQREYLGTWGSWSKIITDKPIALINATLQNGWTGSLYYRKNAIGRLELLTYPDVGVGVTNVGTIIATLPSGYRPLSTTPVSVYNNSTGLILPSCFTLGENGELRIRQNSGFATGDRLRFNEDVVATL